MSKNKRLQAAQAEYDAATEELRAYHESLPPLHEQTSLQAAKLRQLEDAWYHARTRLADAGGDVPDLQP